VIIIFHISTIFIWNLDVEFDVPENIINTVKPYTLLLSTWQAWNIFSPNPSTSEIAIRVIVTKLNETYIHLPKYVEKGMPIFFTRFRKFHENLIDNNNPNLNIAYMVYLCKGLRKTYDGEFDITLQSVSKKILSPLETGEPEIRYGDLGELTCG